MRLLLLSLFALCLVVPLDVFAQEGSTESAGSADAGLEAMAKLAKLVGTWEGTGWMRQGPGEPSHTVSKETVESRLDGRILVVEGFHTAKDDPSHVVHHAFGVISHDAEKSQYRFQTHLANGRGGTHEMRIEGDAILWFIESPHGTVRYTIHIGEGTWKEIGEFSADGKTWREFFGMDLKKVAGPAD